MIVAAVEAARATSILTGLCRKASASRWISGGMVAEKNSVWRVKGTSFTMRSMSGMKPMSSIRSASSMTRSSTPAEQELAALEMVEQPARRRDQHVDAAGDLGVLVAEGDAADQERHGEPVIDAVACRSSPGPGPPARGSARESACAACAPGPARSRAASASAGRRPRSCRCRSGRCRARRAARARGEWPAPGSASAPCSRRP